MRDYIFWSVKKVARDNVTLVDYKTREIIDAHGWAFDRPDRRFYPIKIETITVTRQQLQADYETLQRQLAEYDKRWTMEREDPDGSVPIELSKLGLEIIFHYMEKEAA